MLPAPFLSKLNARRASISSGSVEEVKQQGETNHEIREFQKCMEEVKIEFPHLSRGAQQKLALERNAKKNEERLALAARDQHQPRLERRFSLPDVMLRGAEDIFSKLNLGKQTDVEDGVGVTAGSSAQARRTSFAVKQSVSFSMEEHNMMLAQMDWSEGSNDSLQDSLDNIARSAAIDTRRRSNVDDEKSDLVKSLERRSRRANKHYSSLISGLSDVEEDEETSNESDSFDADDNPPPLKKEQSKSFSDIPPDEIAVVLDGCKDTNKKDGEVNLGPVTGRSRKGRLTDNRINRQNGANNNNKPEKSSFKSMGSESFDEVGWVPDSIVRLNTKEEKAHASPVRGGQRKDRLTSTSRGNDSSFMTVDSANFQGDFWAWRSIDSANFQGDFWAWRSIRSTHGSAHGDTWQQEHS